MNKKTGEICKWDFNLIFQYTILQDTTTATITTTNNMANKSKIQEMQSYRNTQNKI